MALSRLDQRNRANPDMEWKIYYHDPTATHYYSTFSNLDGTPEEAPTQGVLVILQPMENGRGLDRVLYGDLYCMDEEGKWIGMDRAGLQDRLDNKLITRAVKEGRWINLERFLDILYLAGDDKDFTIPEGRTTRLPTLEEQPKIKKR